jgi:hypothetical protein
MRRLSFFIFALLMVMVSWATVPAPADYRVVFKDGTTAYYSSLETEMTFSEDASILYIAIGNNKASYAISGIEEIEFAQAGAYSGKYNHGGAHVDVVIDPTDDTSYTEVKEQVIKDDTHEDYGDFIDNFKLSYTAVIAYDGDKATCSFSPKKPSYVTTIINGAHVSIIAAEEGKIAYSLKGTTANGSFKLYSDKKALVSLDGVSISNPTGSAINIQSSKTQLIRLTDGTTNSLEDGASYTLVAGEQQKGVFFSEGQLVFSGKGSLNVKSNSGHGIASDDYVRVRDGNITINSVRDGISTKDRFIMSGGTLTINANQDGIDVGEGYVEIGAGKINIQAGDEGITASYEGDEDTGEVDTSVTPYMEIKGGLIKVVTTGDKGHGLRAMSTFTMTGGIVQATTKGAGSKALMSEGNMSLVGGKVTAFTKGNALYEDGDLSSSAGIRSKGVLKIENVSLGVKSAGTGGKGINNVGDVVMKNSNVIVVASGATHKRNGLDSRSRGVDTDGNLTLNGGVLLVRSYDEPLHLKGKLSFLGNAVYNGYQIEE